MPESLMATAISELEAADMRTLIHPHATIGEAELPIIVERASGALIWDANGDEYIDGTCGLWQCPVGHGRAELAQVAAEQIERLEFYSSFGQFTNEPAIRLGERLLELAPPGISRVFYTSGGSEGSETAIKLVRLAHWAQGAPDRTVILSRQGAYHGVSYGALAATGLDRLRKGYGTLDPDFVHLSQPHAKKLGHGASEKLVAELEAKIAELGSERIAAFIAEPILGVGGMLPPPEDYWPRIQEVLRRNEILLVIDEVVTAFGRTGHWFACERFGIEPDVVVTAKGLTSGYIPMGAVLVGKTVLDMCQGTAFTHGFTYNGHPVAAAVALANLAIIERERLPERAAAVGARMLDALAPLAELPHVLEVRGVGLMLGVEFESGDASAVERGARDDGLIVRALDQTVLLSPPLVITDEQVDRLVAILSKHVALAAPDSDPDAD